MLKFKLIELKKHTSCYSNIKSTKKQKQAMRTAFLHLYTLEISGFFLKPLQRADAMRPSFYTMVPT